MEVHVEDDMPPPTPERPRTATVAGVLIGAAMLVSWLAAYALPNALVAAELMSPWPAGSDPRPRWLIIGFTLLTGVSAGLVGLFRWMDRRQLQGMEEMDAEDPPAEITPATGSPTPPR